MRDTVSDAFMLAAENTEMGKHWLKTHEDLKYHLIVLFQSSLACFARKEYGLTSGLDCYQAVYMRKEPPVLNHNIQVQIAADEDVKMITDNCNMLNEEELKKIIRRRELFIGMHNLRNSLAHDIESSSIQGNEITYTSLRDDKKYTVSFDDLFKQQITFYKELQ